MLFFLIISEGAFSNPKEICLLKKEEELKLASLLEFPLINFLLF
jgi:hypothetical protein